jgi:hypothetical protein
VENNRSVLHVVSLFKSGELEYRSGRVWRNKGTGYWCDNYTPAGYRAIAISGGHRGSRCYYVVAHRAIWWFLRGPIPEDMQINHLNGIRDDNRIENLEVVTRSENMKHQAELFGRPWTKRRRHGFKLSDDDINAVRQLSADGMFQAELARLFDLSQQMVSRIVLRQRFVTTVPENPPH